MSLEIALQENTAAIKELIAKLTAEGLSHRAAVGTIMHQAAEEATTKPHEAEGVHAASAPHTKVNTGKPEAKKPAAETASSPSGATPPTTEKKADAPTGDRPTYDQVKDKLLALSKEKGREPTVALLSRFGAARGPDLKPDQYAKFIADVDAIFAGTYDPDMAELA